MATITFHRVSDAVRQWRVRRLAVAQLSRLSQHLRRDVGFEPADPGDPLNASDVSVWAHAHMRPDVR